MSAAARKKKPSADPDRDHVLTIRLPPELSQKLKAVQAKYAKREARSVSYNEVICKSLMAYE